jgi:hypothetical protein
MFRSFRIAVQYCSCKIVVVIQIVAPLFTRQVTKINFIEYWNVDLVDKLRNVTDVAYLIERSMKEAIVYTVLRRGLPIVFYPQAL